MATTVHEPPKIEERLPSQGSGNGGWRNLAPAGGDLRRVKHSSPPPASTGIWVVLASITMTFAAFTSALIVRQGGASDWRHFTLPPVLYLNTLVIIASSLTLEMARRRIATFMGGVEENTSNPARWLYVTLSLGLLFVAGQTMRLAAAQIPGLRTRQQCELFIFLCADGSACFPCVRRPRRFDPRHREAAPVFAAAKYSGRHLALLAFHGRAVAVSAFAALDEALNDVEPIQR